MATTTPFGYNTGSTISGTEQIGSLSVGTGTTVNYGSSPNGVKFWMGPNEDLGYVIGGSQPSGNQPTPISGVTASVQFWRSESLTESSIVSLTNLLFNQTFTTGTQSKTYLNTNGFWTSYNKVPFIYGSPRLVFDFSSATSYPNSGTAISDLSGNANNGIFSTGTGNGTPATVTGYNSNGYLNLPGTSAQRSVRLPDSLKPTGTVSFTYIVYMRPKGYSYNGNTPGIMANHDGTNGLFWIIQPTSPNNYAVRNGANVTGMDYTGGTGLNVWTVYALKFDGSSTTIYQYISGTLYSVNIVGATSIVSTSSWGFFLGLRYNQWINADINYVAMYNTALTNSEITTIAGVVSSRSPV